MTKDAFIDSIEIRKVDKDIEFVNKLLNFADKFLGKR